MEEERARAAIVEVAGRAWARGLVAGTSGNISVRLADGGILVTPAGRSLRALNAADIVLLDALGEPREPHRRPTSELLLHLAAYRARPDVACVVHTHPTYCIAWSKTGRLFPLDTAGAIESLGAIVFTAYAPAGSTQLADRCGEAFARGANSVVMERHGLSSVATTLERAFDLTDLAEQTAHIEYCAATLAVRKGNSTA